MFIRPERSAPKQSTEQSIRGEKIHNAEQGFRSDLLATAYVPQHLDALTIDGETLVPEVLASGLPLAKLGMDDIPRMLERDIVHKQHPDIGSDSLRKILCLDHLFSVKLCSVITNTAG
jgi:hypothetical protein